MQEAINRQINRELYSAYFYLSMSVYFESEKLKGFANWMRMQAREETGHAMRLFSYMAERGGRIIMQDIEAPPIEWDSARDVFEHTLKHEKKVTEMINNLMGIAKSENDIEAQKAIEWFVNEQAEEEETAEKILNDIKERGLQEIDKELAERK